MKREPDRPAPGALKMRVLVVALWSNRAATRIAPYTLISKNLPHG